MSTAAALAPPQATSDVEPTADIDVMPHRYTVADYHRIAGTGVFEGKRVQLVDGVVYIMPAMGAPHAGTASRIDRLLKERLGRTANVRVQMPVTTDEFGEPEPDIAICHWRGDDYVTAHPTPADVYCLIEVSDSTVNFDRRIKTPAYAGAGIACLWHIDIADGAAEVLSSPTARRYRASRPLTAEAPLTCETLPGLTITRHDLAHVMP